MTETLRTDGDRLWDSLMEMARIGATPGGGVGRIALTELDRAARDLFVTWCRDAGCQVRVDRMGNIFARRMGRDADRPPVMTGSHLDTQPLGGRFDGIYGVLAGLEVVRSLNYAHVETEAPLDVAVWTDEEGVRFGGGMIASGVFAGIYDVETGLARADTDDITIGAALAAIGYAGNEAVGGYPVEAFFEAHIEQGPILENESVPVGVVLGAQGQKCFKVTVTGAEGHAGTLPLRERRDALLGAARMIAAVNDTAYECDPLPVVTVGSIAARPNSRNTISGQTIFSIDSRHPDDAVLAGLAERMRARCAEIAAAGGLEIDFDLISERPSIAFDPGCIDAVRRAAGRLGVKSRDIYSGAGHDACQLNRIAPTGMIFVPCEDGVSHNERENARPGDLAAGCDVLLHVMLERAGVI